MTRIEQLEHDISALPKDEYRQIRIWFMEHDWAMWDKQIESDSDAGKLDFQLSEVEEEKGNGEFPCL